MKKETIDFKLVKSTPFYSSFSIGLKRNFDADIIHYDEIVNHISHLQTSIKHKMGVLLSAQISQTEIVLFGHQEPHLKLEFINYPNFPFEEDQLKEAVLFLAKQLAEKFDQNRIVINFKNEHLMIEKSDAVDPGVLLDTPQEIQTINLFNQYQGPTLYTCVFKENHPLIKAFPDKIKVITEFEYNSCEGIPLFLKSVQNGKPHPVVPEDNFYFPEPTKVAILNKFLLSGTPISLDIWEVEGNTSLDWENPGRLLKRYK